MEAIEEPARMYFDVNSEGTLLREAHDIIDELQMMARIHFQQPRVTKQFSKKLKDLNEQQVPLTHEEPLRGFNRTLEVMKARQMRTTQDNTSSDMHGTIPDADEDVAGLQIPIPDGTLYRIQNLSEDIEIRLNELQDLEESTKEKTKLQGLSDSCHTVS